MELKDLETGYIIGLRNGKHYIILKDYLGKEGLTIALSFDLKESPLNLYYWYKDMTSYGNREFDIMEVYKKDYSSYEKEELIWEREKIDWSSVKVNTPIWVKNSGLENWLPRYFCKYENCSIYAWDNGATSYTTDDSIKWNYAKLRKEN